MSTDREPVSVFWQRERAPLLSWHLHGDLITVFPSGYLLSVSSDLITLDFLAARGSMCLVHLRTPVPEPSHGICILLKKKSGFPWKAHDPTKYLKCTPLPPPTLNASSSVPLCFTINPAVSINFIFALKMPYRTILNWGLVGSHLLLGCP